MAERKNSPKRRSMNACLVMPRRLGIANAISLRMLGFGIRAEAQVFFSFSHRRIWGVVISNDETVDPVGEVINKGDKASPPS